MFKKRSVNIMAAYACKCERIGRRVFFLFFFQTFLLILWRAKFMYVNLIYAKVIVAHNNTDKFCVQQQQCVCWSDNHVQYCFSTVYFSFIWEKLLSAIQNENIFLCK